MFESNETCDGKILFDQQEEISGNNNQQRARDNFEWNSNVHSSETEGCFRMIRLIDSDNEELESELTTVNNFIVDFLIISNDYAPQYIALSFHKWPLWVFIDS